MVKVIYVLHHLYIKTTNTRNHKKKNLDITQSDMYSKFPNTYTKFTHLDTTFINKFT